MSNNFIDPMLDWSELSIDEMWRTIKTSRQQWVQLASFILNLETKDSNRDRVVKNLRVIIALMMGYELDLRVKTNKNLLTLMKDKDLAGVLAELLYVKNFFLENDTPWETFIDTFDVDVAIDVLIKIIDIGHSNKVLLIASTRAQFESTFNNLAFAERESWELYRPKAETNEG